MWLGEVPSATSASSPFWGLAGALIGLAGTLTAVLVGWIRERDYRVKRSKELDDAVKIASFWDVTLSSAQKLSYTHINEFEERAKEQLSYISQDLDMLIDIHRQEQQTVLLANTFINKRKLLPPWKKLFLIYKPPRRRAWIVRVLFYLIVLMVLTVPSAMYSDWRDVHTFVVARDKYRNQPVDKMFGLFSDTPENRKIFKQGLDENAHREYDNYIHDARTSGIVDSLANAITVILCFVLWLISRRLELPKHKSF